MDRKVKNLRRRIKEATTDYSITLMNLEELEDKEYLNRDERDYKEYLENELSCIEEDIADYKKQYLELTGREFCFDMSKERAAV